MVDKIYLGFDFSMNKPAMTIWYDGHFYFYIWPLDMKDDKVQLYKTANVDVVPRGLGSVSLKDMSSSQMTLEHTKRSTELAETILESIVEFFKANNVSSSVEMFVSSEGLSFGSKGDSTLNLATYKGVFLSALWKKFKSNIKVLATYAPISIKSVAGCVRKAEMNDKNKMIDAFMKETFDFTCPFSDALKDGRLLKPKAKTVSYIECADDIVDSYFALKTMLVKEKLI